MSNASSMKAENDRTFVNSMQGIKQEPGFSTPAHLDEDIYEDAGDLDFQEPAEALYLTRLPKFLWKTWSQLEDDQEIQVGTIRVEGDIQKPLRMSLMLSDSASVNQTMPKEYNMEITNRQSTNTFVFTEKDLPGFSTRSRGPARRPGDDASQPFSQAAPRVHLQDRPKAGPSSIDKSKRFKSHYRTAIPKKTSFIGHVRTEVNCLPVENSEYRRLMKSQALREAKPKREIKLLTGRASAHSGNVLGASAQKQQGNFASFIKPIAPIRARGQDLKAARIPQNELLDLIYECFKKYKYWPLKRLKQDLNQPEAYLKETLEMVAQLIRQGPHAMTWQLKPESRLGAYSAFDLAQDIQAPDITANMDGPQNLGDGLASDEDEDGMKMEDVLPSV